jgi:predicted peroxiredoxin
VKLGILVTSDRFPDKLVGLARAASARGHEVTIFFMGTGTLLLRHPQIHTFAGSEAFDMSYCAYNAEVNGVLSTEVPDNIELSSQVNNALMISKVDKVIHL